MTESRSLFAAQPASDPDFWRLDRKVIFLNHGSFGSCPRPVLGFQQELRERMERHPIRFLVRDLEPLLDQARADLARFVGADPANLVFVPVGADGKVRIFNFHGNTQVVADVVGYLLKGQDPLTRAGRVVPLNPPGEDGAPNTDATADTQPLPDEQIARLRTWAEGRARNASVPRDGQKASTARRMEL